jgi:hypothetical protein
MLAILNMDLVNIGRIRIDCSFKTWLTFRGDILHSNPPARDRESLTFDLEKEVS